MNIKCSTGTVFQFDSYGICFIAVFISHQNGKVQCFRVCTSKESSETIEMHTSDGQPVDPNYRIAYKSCFEIYMSQVRKLLFTCSKEDIFRANRLYRSLSSVKSLRVEAEEAKRRLSRLTGETRKRALKKIERLNKEINERECIFLQKNLRPNKSRYYGSFRVVPNQRGITQIYGLYQEWHARKIYR